MTRNLPSILGTENAMEIGSMKNGISGKLGALLSVTAIISFTALGMVGCQEDKAPKPRANARIDGRILVVRDSAAGGVLR